MITTETTGGSTNAQIATYVGTQTGSTGVTKIGYATTTTETSPAGVTTVTTAQSVMTTSSRVHATTMPSNPRTYTYGTLETDVSNLEAGTHFEPNVAESAGVLVAGTMVTTYSIIIANPVLFVGSAEGTFDTFVYLAGNPNPNPTRAAQTFGYGFAKGVGCYFLGFVC